MPRDSLKANYGITNFFEKLIFNQQAKVIQEGGNFSRYVIGQLIWMVVLMMPALALILKLLYIRRKYYYVEHIIFSFHYHAFAFLLISVGMIIDHWRDQLINGDGTFTSISFIVVLIYLFIAMRRVYKQGAWKTFIKYNILNWAYLFIFSIFIALTFVISALTF